MGGGRGAAVNAGALRSRNMQPTVGLGGLAGKTFLFYYSPQGVRGLAVGKAPAPFKSTTPLRVDVVQPRASGDERSTFCQPLPAEVALPPAGRQMCYLRGESPRAVPRRSHHSLVRVKGDSDMSHASALRGMSSQEDARRYIEKNLPPVPIELPPDLNLRVGQEAVLRLAGEAGARRVIAKLVTGYGKSLAIVAAFAARERIDDSRFLLIVVPTDEQRGDFVRKAGELYNRIARRRTDVWDISGENELRAERAVRSGDCRIVVTTIQKLSRDASGARALLEISDQWMVAFDEIQYYARQKKPGAPISPWTQQADWLCNHPSVRFVLGVSATPVRSDGRLTYFGEWDLEIPPKVAIDEKAIRRVVAHLDTYTLDITLQGEDAPRRVKTSEIDGWAAREGLDIKDWEIRHDVRYHTKYISRVFGYAYQQLLEAQIDDDRASMIVFAMSVKHAETVAASFNSLAGERVADYIGVQAAGSAVSTDPQGKSDRDNRATIERFKAGQLRVLVQVAMASVGFDHQPACIGVFLNAIGETVLLSQMVGRVLRYTDRLPFAHIIASDDHPGSGLFRTMQDDYSIEEPDEPEPGNGGNGGSEPWPPFPSWRLIDVKYDRTKVFRPWGGNEGAAVAAAVESARVQRPSASQDDLETVVRRIFAEKERELEIEAAAVSAVDRLNAAKAQVRAAEGAVANAMFKARRMHSPPSAYAGDVKKTLSGHWVRSFGRGHKQMDAADFEKKHAWLREIFDLIKAGEIPTWLP